MKYDKPILAIVFILPPLILAEIFLQVLKFFNFTTVSALEAMSMMWFPEGSLLLGVVAAFGIASWTALIIYYSPKIIGHDYFPFKSMLIVMTVQSLIFSVYGVLGRNPNLTQNVSGNLTHSFAAAAGGLITGYLYKKYLYSQTEN